MKRKFFKKNRPNDFLDPDEILMDSVSALSPAGRLENRMERPIEKFSYTLFLVLIGLGVSYLGVRAGLLQVRAGGSYFAQSQENRFLTRPVLPPRGIIYDREGKNLVENHPSFGIALDKEEFIKAGGEPEDLVLTLSGTLGKSAEYFYDQGIPGRKEDVDRLPPRVILAQGLAPEAVVSAASRLHTIPGIQIFEDYRRVYGYPSALAHLLGFTGRVSEEDLLRNPEFLPQDTVGKTGVELAYDSILRGKVGKKIVEVDAVGKETRFKLVEEPEAGRDITLSVDGELQRVAYEVVKNYTQGKKGASVVALDPRDGSVLALVSFPGYDSNSFGYALSRAEFQAVVNDPLKPLFNRALGGEFPSGSIIKPIIGAAALEEKIIDPEKQVLTEGFIEVPNPYKPGEKSVFLDWKNHGWVDFYKAIAQSVNVYFYMVGGGYREQKGLGIEKIKQYANSFGLGNILGIDLPGERPGLVPDPAWKAAAEKDDPTWRVGDTYNVSIGQGGMKVTPLQMAAATAAIANGGRLYRPRVIAGVAGEKADPPYVLREGMASPDTLAQVVRGMRQAVTSGTARLLSSLPVAAAAKTGTAQAGSGLPHAWVTAFAPAENPRIAMVVMVEHAGEGSTVAVPITNEILKWYFSNRIGN